MKLIKRFILFLSIFLLVVPIHQTARAYQYGKNAGTVNAACYRIGIGATTPHHIIQHRRSYITAASASHSRKPGGAHNPAEENAAANDQPENEEDETIASKKQDKQTCYFPTAFSTQPPGYFDHCTGNRISSAIHSYTSSYRYILYNAIRI